MKFSLTVRDEFLRHAKLGGRKEAGPVEAYIPIQNIYAKLQTYLWLSSKWIFAAPLFHFLLFHNVFSRLYFLVYISCVACLVAKA